MEKKMITILFFIFCLGTTGASYRVNDIKRIPKEDLMQERQLEVINKHPMKSIHYGDIVDCIDINKQPAFDHPLLKYHKLQRKPSNQKSFEKTRTKNSPDKLIFELGKDKCPRGTVPIPRTTKDNMTQDNSFLNNHIFTQDKPGNHQAELPMFSPFYKVSGKNSIYNPQLQRKDQTSSSYLWVQNGPANAYNMIALGWHVAPQLYGGDDSTYIFSLWSSDGFKKTGCYNLQCPSFVQTHPGNYIGSRVDNISIYGGTMIEFDISIFQDAKSGNWWLNIGNENIGYFPSSLFSNMASADKVGWGGRTTTPSGAPSPQMGSGYFPDDNFVHACYFRHVSFHTESRMDQGPKNYHADIFDDKSDCFGVEYYGDQGGEVGYSLQFGGPGGNCGD